MTTKQKRTSVFRSTAPRLALVLLALAATRPMRVVGIRSGHRRLADVGRHARPQHGVDDEGHAHRPGTSRRRRTSSGWRRSARRATAIRSSPAGMVYVGTNNEAARDPKRAGRPRRADGVPRVGRRVPVAADQREARRGPRQRLAVSGRLLLAAGGRRRSSTTSRIAASCASISTDYATGTTAVDEKHGAEDADYLEVRHDGGGRLPAAQHVELVAGHPTAI